MNPSRIGDLAEYNAVVWLLEQGYEVFKNTGCTGPADLMAWDLETGKITPIDVKSAVRRVNKEGVMKVCASGPRYPGVSYLLYIKDTKDFVWEEDQSSRTPLEAN